jgi:hypothetical protein
MWQHCPEHEGGSLTHEWPAPPLPPEPSDPEMDETVACLMDALYTHEFCACDDDIGKTCGFCENTAGNFRRIAVDLVARTRQDEREKAAQDGAREALETVEEWTRHSRSCCEESELAYERIIQARSFGRPDPEQIRCTCGLDDALAAIRGGGK